MALDESYRDYFIRNLHDALSGHTSSSVDEAVKSVKSLPMYFFCFTCKQYVHMYVLYARGTALTFSHYPLKFPIQKSLIHLYIHSKFLFLKVNLCCQCLHYASKSSFDDCISNSANLIEKYDQ